MTGEAHTQFAAHLLRSDGQEDLCFAAWRPSNGRTRTTALLGRPILPELAERQVHGNASFDPTYALRAAQEAGQRGHGLAFMHSHPGGQGWQPLNEVDRVAERRIANLAGEITGLPLVGLTLAGDEAWSARIWNGAGRHVAPQTCESVRVIGDAFSVTFDDTQVPVPRVTGSQDRTVHTWGEVTQARIARLRIAVVGTGSVGMIVAEALGRTGVQHVGVFDFDTVEHVNLDRLRGTGVLDAILRRAKAQVAQRLLSEGSTAVRPTHEIHELSICEPEALSLLLDFDIVFSCVDRPWPRHVLNTVSYSDLIPVVEGGLTAFRNTDGSLRNAYWRSTIAKPGRPCLACLGQYDPALVQVERDGSLQDPSYIANLPAGSPLRRRENVASFSVSAAAALLEQFVAHVAQPSGFGDPGPLMFSLRDHMVTPDPAACSQNCPRLTSVGCGDARLNTTARHHAAELARQQRRAASFGVRLGRRLDDLLWNLRQRASQLAARRRSDE